MLMKVLRVLTLVASLGLVVAACGGGDDSGGGDEESRDASDDSTTTTTETTEPPVDTTTTTALPDDRSDAIDEFGDEVKDDLGDVANDTTTYGEYVVVNDDSGTLAVEVPAAWTDVDGSQGLFGPDVIASTDVQAWIQTYDVSGLEFQATDIETSQSTDQILDAVSQGQANQCTVQPRSSYSDPRYTGVAQVFENCGGSETDFIWVAFEPADGLYHGVIGVQITNEADIEALERALNSFIVNV